MLLFWAKRSTKGGFWDFNHTFQIKKKREKLISWPVIYYTLHLLPRDLLLITDLFLSGIEMSVVNDIQNASTVEEVNTMNHVTWTFYIEVRFFLK